MDPRPAGSIPLEGDTDSWRVKVGDYRIIYTVCDGQLLVLVLSAAHRREVASFRSQIIDDSARELVNEPPAERRVRPVPAPAPSTESVPGTI